MLWLWGGRACFWRLSKLMQIHLCCCLQLTWRMKGLKEEGLGILLCAKGYEIIIWGSQVSRHVQSRVCTPQKCRSSNPSSDGLNSNLSRSSAIRTCISIILHTNKWSYGTIQKPLMWTPPRMLNCLVRNFILWSIETYPMHAGAQSDYLLNDILWKGWWGQAAQV